jgi:hypothetical protein
MPELSRVPRNTVLVAVLAIASSTAVWSEASFYRTPRPGTQYLSIFLFLVLGVVLLVCVGRALSGLRQNRRSSVVLGGAALLSVVVAFEASRVGWWLRDRDFQRLRPKMERIVEDYRASPDSGRLRLEGSDLPEELSRRIYTVWGTREQAGRVDVWFFDGLGWPPNHSAWIFTSDSTASGASIRGNFWHRSLRLTPYWYDASD